tara:strand:+ start:85 stop:486 length:402 start_codon:yes stop_codon:yes gene_type:complete
MIEIITLFITIYYNNIDNNYYKLLSLNKLPSGPIKNYISSISVTNPSTKINKSRENYCILSINSSILNINYNSRNFNKYINLCTIEDITEIYEFLINNNYSINNELNNILNSNINCNNNNNNNNILFTFNYKN